MIGHSAGSRLSAGLRLEPAPWSGSRWADLRFPDGIVCSIAHVRRGDADMMPHPDLILEVGDRVGLLANRSHTKAMRKFFGDSIKGTAELSFISIGIGAALGLLLGMIPLPIPGGGEDDARPRRAAAAGPVPGQAAPHRPLRLDDAVLRQPGAAGTSA